MVHTGVKGPAVLTFKNAALESEELIGDQVFGFNGFILLLWLFTCC